MIDESFFLNFDRNVHGLCGRTIASTIDDPNVWVVISLCNFWRIGSSMDNLVGKSSPF